jgi:hypothetical protein
VADGEGGGGDEEPDEVGEDAFFHENRWVLGVRGRKRAYFWDSGEFQCGR